VTHAKDKDAPQGALRLEIDQLAADESDIAVWDLITQEFRRVRDCGFRSRLATGFCSSRACSLPVGMTLVFEDLVEFESGRTGAR
jgi:hypothetical protein